MKLTEFFRAQLDREVRGTPQRPRTRSRRPQRLEAASEIDATGLPCFAGGAHAELDRHDDRHRRIQS